MTHKSMLALFLVLFISLPPFTPQILPSFANDYGITAEAYIPNNDFSSKTLSVKLPKQPNNDHFLTIRYSLNDDRLSVFDHGKKISDVNLSGEKFNVRDLINELKLKHDSGEIKYLKINSSPLSSKRILENYKRIYNTVKVSPSPPSSLPESHFAELMVSTTNLIAHYDASNLDNAGNSADSADTATTWTDRSGNAYNGTLNNFTLPTAGSASGWDGLNTASSPSLLKFDGTDDNVSIDNSALNNFADYGAGTGTTVSVWAKTNSATDQTVVCFGSSTTSTPFLALTILSGGPVRYQYRTDNGNELNGGSWDTTKSVIDNKWHHLVLRRSGSTFEIYIDGAVEKTGTSSASLNTVTTNRQSIGAFRYTSTNQYFNGQVGNVRLYNAALTADQIRINYLAEAYKFQGTDNIAPGVYGDEDLRAVNYKKATDTFDVYIADANPVANGDNDINAIASVSCTFGSQSLSNPTPTEQNYTGGLTFDGSNDYVSVNDSSVLNPTSFTISALIKTSQTTIGRIVNKENTTGGGQRYSLAINITANKVEIRFDASDSSGAVRAISSTSVNDNKWHYVVGVFDDSADSLKIYVDGALETTTSTTKTPLVSNQPLHIGRFNQLYGEYFNGQIANARIYNRALTATEITRDYRYRYEPTDPTGLVAWYKLDDGNLGSNSGTTATARKWSTTTNSIVTDSNLNGTLTNFGFTTSSGWANQYSYNINKYTYTIPSFGTVNQIEKLQCTVTDAAGNSTATNEEVGGTFISRAGPIITTNIAASASLVGGNTISATVTENTPDSSILASTLTPSIDIAGNTFATPCSITTSTLTKAETFDGVDDYFTVPHSSSINVSDPFTISVWAKSPSANTIWVAKSASNASAGWALRAYAGAGVRFDAENGYIEVNATASSIFDGGWHHIVGVRNGTTAQVYVDNVLIASATNSTTGVTANTGPFTIAYPIFGWGSNGYSGGSFDDVQLYNRALSPTEISYLYSNPGKVFNPRGQVAWYRFDQLEDTDSNATSDNIRDYSGNSNHGTLTNYSSLSAGIVDSTITNSIDGITGTCSIVPDGLDPPTAGASTNGTLTIGGISNANSVMGSTTKANVTFTKNYRPRPPRIISAVRSTGAPVNLDGTTWNTSYGETLTLNFSSPDFNGSDTVTLSAPTAPTRGTFTANSAANPGTGSYVFSPSPSDAGMSYTFTVRATDNNGATSASDLTLTIKAPSSAPQSVPSLPPAPSSSTASTSTHPLIPAPTPIIQLSPVPVTAITPAPLGISVTSTPKPSPTPKPSSIIKSIDISTGKVNEISIPAEIPSTVPPTKPDTGNSGNNTQTNDPSTPQVIDLSTAGRPPQSNPVKSPTPLQFIDISQHHDINPGQKNPSVDSAKPYIDASIGGKVPKD